MKKQYTLYLRQESGAIERMPTQYAYGRQHADPEQIATDYPHAESLTGWPESIVHWQSAKGFAVGLAE